MRVAHSTALCILLLVPTVLAGVWEADAVTLSRTFRGEAESFGNWGTLDGVQRASVRDHLDSLLEIAQGLLNGWMSELVEKGLDEETVAALWGRLKKLKAKLEELSTRAAMGMITKQMAEGYYSTKLVEIGEGFQQLANLFDDAGL
jgi:hypothetical protein